MATPEERVVVEADLDIVEARRVARAVAAAAGFSATELTIICTAVSELGRNIVQYAGRGEMIFRLVRQGERAGIEVVTRDDGPGIADLNQAMQDGYSTGGGLGLGLPGTKRLMDEFAIVSEPGKGTTITVTKWTH